MMINRTAIIDSSVLRALYHLNILHHLNMIYAKVYVPREVEKEFLRTETDARHEFIEMFYDEHGNWFEECNTYRDETIELLNADGKIDPGEIEVIAQNIAMENRHDALLDDKDARKIARMMSVTLHGTLYILAHMSYLGLCEYRASVDRLRKCHGARYSDEIIREVYEMVKASFANAIEE